MFPEWDDNASIYRHIQRTWVAWEPWETWATYYHQRNHAYQRTSLINYMPLPPLHTTHCTFFQKNDEMNIQCSCSQIIQIASPAAEPKENGTSSTGCSGNSSFSSASNEMIALASHSRNLSDLKPFVSAEMNNYFLSPDTLSISLSSSQDKKSKVRWPVICKLENVPNH